MGPLISAKYINGAKGSVHIHISSHKPSASYLQYWCTLFSPDLFFLKDSETSHLHLYKQPWKLDSCLFLACPHSTPPHPPPTPDSPVGQSWRTGRGLSCWHKPPSPRRLQLHKQCFISHARNTYSRAFRLDTEGCWVTPSDFLYHGNCNFAIVEPPVSRRRHSAKRHSFHRFTLQMPCELEQKNCIANNPMNNNNAD